MGFVGQVNRLGDAYIRPHEVVICAAAEPGCEPATVERVLAFGFAARVDFGRRRAAGLGRAGHPEAEQLGVSPARPSGSTSVAAGRSGSGKLIGAGGRQAAISSPPIPLRRAPTPGGHEADSQLAGDAESASCLRLTCPWRWLPS